MLHNRASYYFEVFLGEDLELQALSPSLLGESVDVVGQFSLFALDVIMRAAFGMENNIQMNADPELVEKARNVFQTPIWIRFFSMFPFWGYFSR